MDYLIIEKNGQYIDSRSIEGLNLLKFRKQSIVGSPILSDVDGRRGQVSRGKKFGVRPIATEWWLESRDLIDLDFLVDEMMRLFHSEKEIGIIHSRQPGRRWYVNAESDFEPNYINSYTATIELTLSAAYPYAKSLGTSLSPKTFDSDLWQIGQGLISEDTPYEFSSSHFRVFNPSDITITPSEHPIIIAVYGSTNNFSLTNLTTGENITYYGSSSKSDKLIFNRYDHYKNNDNIMSETNHGAITLKPGWNDFIATGKGSGTVSFDFPFYYV
ncbi:phage tail domain-containing protein [Niallia sp. FSL K6-0077]|uniref:phage tail domain-containing protein n=1 Tax=Niallia sp. FSL K6-0077 TaxID=2954743 RepID=UPI0030F5B073